MAPRHHTLNRTPEGARAAVSVERPGCDPTSGSRKTGANTAPVSLHRQKRLATHDVGAADGRAVDGSPPAVASQPPRHQADDATNLARPSLAIRNCIIASAAALIAAVTIR